MMYRRVSLYRCIAAVSLLYRCCIAFDTSALCGDVRGTIQHVSAVSKLDTAGIQQRCIGGGVNLGVKVMFLCGIEVRDVVGRCLGVYPVLEDW